MRRMRLRRMRRRRTRWLQGTRHSARRPRAPPRLAASKRRPRPAGRWGPRPRTAPRCRCAGAFGVPVLIMGMGTCTLLSHGSECSALVCTGCVCARAGLGPMHGTHVPAVLHFAYDVQATSLWDGTMLSAHVNACLLLVNKSQCGWRRCAHTAHVCCEHNQHSSRGLRICCKLQEQACMWTSGT